MANDISDDKQLAAALRYWERRLGEPALRQHIASGPFPSGMAHFLDPSRNDHEVLDVLPGAVSNLGPVLAGKNLSLVIADPRADAFAAQLQRLDISYAGELVATAPEALAARLGESRFDIVVCDNALDLCHDPAEALRQMLLVVRPGGWVCLAGACNTAVSERYGGARHWNIELRGGRLFAWNRTTEQDLHALISNLAETDISQRETDGRFFFRAWLRRRPTQPLVGLKDASVKALGSDTPGRFREIVCDPLNLLIERHPRAGLIADGLVTLHNGNVVPTSGPQSYYGDFSQILIINRGVHEPVEEYVFQEVLRVLPEAPVMLELGAYWAHYSMWMKSRRPQAQVYMVEPEALNLQAGRGNFERNGYEGTFLQAMVGRGHFQVDEFIRTLDGGRLDLLHVDIQGFEAEMLEGAAHSLANGLVDYAFISTHSQDIHEQIIRGLEAFGMRVEVSSRFDYGTTSHDGFVFASRQAKAPVFSGFAPMGLTEIMNATPAQTLPYLAGRLMGR